MRDNVKRQVENQARRRRQLRKQQKPAKDVFIPDAISVSNLAGLLGARIGHFENKMRSLGMETIRHDHILTSEEASLLALEYNVNPIVGTTEKLFDLTPKPEPEDMSIYPLRPPVVTIMGHVDHGKTTLLDSLRKTSVAAGEAGGITQHIGAFSVTLPSKQQITFLDTPGHAAFSAMRARGAHTTDIVVLVVAAEDGVMPQTIEAIKHAEEAGVPIVVAINKCDKYGADPDKAKQALLKYGITVEDLGGETQCVEVSGLTGMNLDKLEETILTLAEVLDLRAEVDMKGEGHVIESQIEKGRGSVATVLVKRGTLRVGDNIVAGDTWCKVKALVNDQGKAVKEAPPGTPVKEQAKLVVENRTFKRERREQLKTLVAINEKRRIVAEEEDEEKTALRDYKHKVWLFHQGILEHHPEQRQVKKQLSVAAMAAKEEEESEVKHLRMVVKGDVSGTVEAVCDALSGLPANQVKVGVIQSGVGNITESDIQFASSCSAMILGFNVKADKKLQQTARQMGVNIKSYGVIYKLLDDVKVEMAMLLPKDTEIQVIGEAKVAQVFPIKLKGGQTQNVAGCRVTNGGVSRKEEIRIVREGEVIWEGRLSSLKRVKEDIQEAKKGTECGMEFEGFQEFKEGDMIQSLKKVEVLRKL
ncbi:MAG: translation initiation factor IF-2 [Benniella sp.]|nr:MAG: translation initiation factor IF-2 [Benniella sp.]